IKIDALLKFPIGNRLLILPGQYPVKVQADGFQSIDQGLEIGSDRHQQIELQLTRLPGKLDIQLQSDLQSTATVFIDENNFGTLPGLIDRVPAGERKITIDAPLYRPLTKTILVQGKGQTESLTLLLEEAWAEYQFTSEPQNATVYVDDVDVGVTPLTLKLEEGARSVRFEQKGFKNYERGFAVVAQQNTIVPVVNLIPADGVLSLVSEPENAAVILNGQYRGNTPLKLNVMPNQSQTLQVYKAGYRLVQQELSLAPNQLEEKQLALSADLVAVKVSVSPSDADVYVNGVRRGKGSQTLNLSTLPHTISVRKPGYVTQNDDIIPTRGQKQIVSVKLLTQEQHYWAQIPNSYTNAVGHSMTLFRAPGQVKLGSSRRETGRRANETQYTVELTKPFYVSLHETTNKQFRNFKATHNAGNYKKKSLDLNQAPAVNISWQQAALYCNWLSEKEGLDLFYQTKRGFVSGYNASANGYRLLTEAEWAWLARNKNGDLLTYPWGNQSSPPSGKAVDNFADKQASGLITFILQDYDDGYRGSAPVGRFPPNHRGLFDIGGNASEWVNDWYSASGSSKESVKDPLGPDVGEFHVIRGASWAKGHLPQLRLAYRGFGAKGQHDVGFRVARYAGLNKSSTQNSHNQAAQNNVAQREQ
nr:PEGA domain-containing protein [Acidiferrobacterales bacterium]